MTSSGTTHTFTFPANLLSTTTAASTYQVQGNYVTALTGDVAASGPGSAATTLATVNSNVGTFGDATHVLQATVNGKGLITAASSVAITGLLTSNLHNGRVVFSTSATSISDSPVFLYNGTVIGVNATSSTISLNVQGSGTLDSFAVASSSGASELIVKSTGSIGINTSTPSSTAKLDINGQAYSEYFNIGTTSAATLAVDWSKGNVQGTVLATTTKISFSNQKPGGTYTLFLTQDGGSRTASYATSSPAINFPAATAPTLSTATGTIDILNFVCGYTNCYGVSATNFASSTNIQLP